MNKTIYGIALALVLGTTGALAGNGNGPGQGDGSCVGNCPQNGGGGGPTEVTNENTNTNTNSNEASAGAISGSSADSTATGIGFGGSSTVGVAVKTGGAHSGSVSNAEGGQGGDGGNAHASGGDAYASGGDSYSGAYSEGSNAGASVGDVTSSSGPSNSSASNGGNSTGDITVAIKGDKVTYEDSASRAASVYAQVCQSGGSAQGQAGGFSIVNSEPLCEHLKMAAVMREAYVWELNHGSANCVEPMSGPKMDNGVTYSDVCFNEKAKKYYDSYHEHMADAMLLLDKTEEAGLVDKFAGYLVRPMALVGALIWLL